MDHFERSEEAFADEFGPRFAGNGGGDMAGGGVHQVVVLEAGAEGLAEGEVGQGELA